VRVLAGSRGGHTFRPAGERLLKGLAELVVTLEVPWAPLASDDGGPAGGLALPHGLDAAEVFGFAGRASERRALDAAWAATLAGDQERRLVLVSGEPGAGKTRLAAEFARAVHAGGVAVLFGRCDEDLGVPFQPFVEALQGFVAALPDDRVAGALGPHPEELARVVPEIAQRAGPLATAVSSSPEFERYWLFEAFARWLGALSAGSGLVVVLDDLHWATKPTLLLLEHVLRAEGPARLLVVATYRDTDLDRMHPLASLLGELRRLPAVSRVSLRGLAAGEVEEMIASAAGYTLGADEQQLAAAVHAETAGNPFFVSEVLRALAEGDDLVFADGRWRLGRPVEEIGIPQGVREAIGRRLSRLPEVANDVLGRAAVIGAEIDMRLLLAVCDQSEDDVLGAVEAAMGAGLIGDAGTDRFRFAHALVRSTLYGELPTSRRVRLHRRIGLAAENLYAARIDAHLGELAYHFAQAASTGEDERAVTYSMRAGEQALAQRAPDEAVSHFARALALLDAADEPPDPLRRLDVCTALGAAQSVAGDPASSATLREVARDAHQRGDNQRLAAALLAGPEGSVNDSLVASEEYLEFLRDAVAASGPADPLRPRLLARLAARFTFHGPLAQRRPMIDEALPLARVSGDLRILLEVLGYAIYALNLGCPTADIAALVSEQHELSHRAADLPQQFNAEMWGRFFAEMRGDRAGMDEALVRMAELAAQTRQPALQWWVGEETARGGFPAGALAEVERRNDEVFALGSAIGLGNADTTHVGILMWVRWHQGRAGEVADLARRYASDYAFFPASVATASFVLAAAGHTDEAERLFEGLWDADRPRITEDPGWLAGMVLLGRVAALIGAPARAAVLYETLAAHRLVTASVPGGHAGPVAFTLGLLARRMGDPDQANTDLTDAISVSEKTDDVLYLAHGRIALAQVLAERARPGDHDQARALARLTLTAAETYGLGGVERDTHDLLVLLDEQDH